ncbi:MAG TPA: GNAT family N-acetyltransferase [Candidatus Koribacter sp.]|jgi:ribosomal protein S18 acetylase RimI-like enzyme
MPKAELTCTVRPVEARDEGRWRELWDAYTRFYEREPREELTRHTWKRIMDPASSVHALVAESDAGEILGIANYIIHENTSQLTPSCYLQDLIVDSKRRGYGVGGKLIDWLIAEMKAQRWSRLYWMTRENNDRARSLYDKYTPHSGFVRYVIANTEV